MDKLDVHFMLRCTREDRDAVRQMSERLGVTPANVARIALREGLKIVGDRGIQPVREEPRN
jgi:hypothetical protein